MNQLAALDEVVTELAQLLHASAPMPGWRSVTLFAKYTPDGSVSGHDYDYHLDSGAVDQGAAPSREARARINALTERHWRLTQDRGMPRWYKMTITVERQGKFSVDFAYRDVYKEGDILQRG